MAARRLSHLEEYLAEIRAELWQENHWHDNWMRATFTGQYAYISPAHRQQIVLIWQQQWPHLAPQDYQI
jgi:hypothetical protein